MAAASTALLEHAERNLEAARVLVSSRASKAGGATGAAATPTTTTTIRGTGAAATVAAAAADQTKRVTFVHGAGIARPQLSFADKVCSPVVYLLSIKFTNAIVVAGVDLTAAAAAAAAAASRLTTLSRHLCRV